MLGYKVGIRFPLIEATGQFYKVGSVPVAPHRYQHLIFSVFWKLCTVCSSLCVHILQYNVEKLNHQ